MEFRLGSTGVAPGESTVLRVHVRKGASLDDVAVTAAGGVAVHGPGIRVNDPRTGLHEVDFRLRAEKVGVHEISVEAGGATVTKTVTVADGPALVSPRRPSPDFLDSLLYPIEPPVPADGPIESVEVIHGVATVPFLGIDWAWWTLFLVFMVLSLFLLKGPMGIDF
jgi:hypothetical protein